MGGYYSVAGVILPLAPLHHGAFVDDYLKAEFLKQRIKGSDGQERDVFPEFRQMIVTVRRGIWHVPGHGLQLVPELGANALRNGVMRRALAEHYLVTTELHKTLGDEAASSPEQNHFLLFALGNGGRQGGGERADGNGTLATAEHYEKLRRFYLMCPPLAVFGGNYAGHWLPSLLRVGPGVPALAEFKGVKSLWPRRASEIFRDLGLGEDFSGISWSALKSAMAHVQRETQKPLPDALRRFVRGSAVDSPRVYGRECIPALTPLLHQMDLVKVEGDDELWDAVRNCFLTGVWFLVNAGYLGASKAGGRGRVAFSYCIYDAGALAAGCGEFESFLANAKKRYEQYLKDRAGAIRDYFSDLKPGGPKAKDDLPYRASLAEAMLGDAAVCQGLVSLAESLAQFAGDSSALEAAVKVEVEKLAKARGLPHAVLLDALAGKEGVPRGSAGWARLIVGLVQDGLLPELKAHLEALEQGGDSDGAARRAKSLKEKWLAPFRRGRSSQTGRAERQREARRRSGSASAVQGQ
jgi:hypothetical protein